MRQSGAISGGAVQEPAAIPAPKSGAPQPSPNVHDLNVPYEVTDDYEAPADDMPYPPVNWLCNYCQSLFFSSFCICSGVNHLPGKLYGNSPIFPLFSTAGMP
jgi:hypothetical protein